MENAENYILAITDRIITTSKKTLLATYMYLSFMCMYAHHVDQYYDIFISYPQNKYYVQGQGSYFISLVNRM